jgi:tripartite-type tricarboxylate transporter receptor subunit TctC
MKSVLGLVCACALSMIASAAFAQNGFPQRPVHLIIPATPGGPVDTAIRVVEPALSAALGGTVVLLNKPGASGTLGMQAVATADADGYTIGQGINSIFSITRITGTDVPFSLDDFALLGNYASDISVLAVHPDAPWKTFDDFVKDAIANPGKRTYASAGIGTVSALSMEVLRHHKNLDMIAVPFSGGAQVMTAVLGKQVDTGMVPYSTGAAMFRDGKLRPLLTTAPKRLAALPDVPTFGEIGIQKEGLNLIMGLYAPRALKPDISKVLTDAVQTAAKNPETVKKLEAIGLFAIYEDPDSALKRLRSEYDDIAALKSEIAK